MSNTAMIRKATPGTVLHGTLRPEDMLESFASELEHNVQRNAEVWCSDEGRRERDRLLALVAKRDDADSDYHTINDIMDELQAFAPEGHYFGSHPGDGADFGYWPSE